MLLKNITQSRVFRGAGREARGFGVWGGGGCDRGRRLTLVSHPS